jgi:hypothetical protein
MKRNMVPELVALGISAVVLAMQYPDLGLALHRTAVASLQAVARVAGTTALKLEAAYKVKVAP